MPRIERCGAFFVMGACSCYSLAREEGVSVDIDVAWYAAFAGKLAPTGGGMTLGEFFCAQKKRPEQVGAFS